VRAHDLRTAAAAAALACGGCTVNLYRNVIQPAAPIVEKTQTRAVTASCILDWRGFAPVGWRVWEVRALTDRPPAGCDPPQLLFHPQGVRPEWDSTATSSSEDLVRGAVAETVAEGGKTRQRLHLFTGGASPPPSVIVRTVIVRWRLPRNLPKGDKGDKGDRGDRGETGPPGRDGSRSIGSAETSGETDKARDKSAEDETQRKEKKPSSPLAKAIAPALAGGGLVYGLMAFNLLSPPRRRAAAPGRRPREEGREDTRSPPPAPADLHDPRVRIRSSGFE
jgi:hypothetical protein